MTEKLHRAAMPKWRRKRLPLAELSIEQILGWADGFHSRVGRWPKRDDGKIAEGLGLKWQSVENALRLGLHGLPGGSSLVQLLAERRGYRNIAGLPKLSFRTMLAWADAWHERTGSWPKNHSGLIPGTRGESWQSVDSALRAATRGVSHATSLAKLLLRHRGVRNNKGRTRLSVPKILRWADAHYRRSGRWPGQDSGPIAGGVPDETWRGIDGALFQGLRGLPGGSSIAKILASHRGVRNPSMLPPLTTSQILAWADAHHARTGTWPRVLSGQIVDAEEGQTWLSVDNALRKGHRGLPSGSSLHGLLRLHRGLES